MNINTVVITGNLTKDPEIRSFESGSSVCELRVAVNTRRKNSETGEWEDKPNYFDVKVWNKRGVACSEHLEKGRPVAVQGRLDWREWEAKDGSGKRQKVEILATDVQFLGSGNGSKDSAPADEPAP
ncbi:MAG TPA: single-stranded DNA-binding protein, partial [Solirubrobacterales bacterium]|nr:single-stranded DNA-binding protein [Solirubrobacterales bacterium]